MKKKNVLPEKEKTTLSVDKATCYAVRLYAEKHGISITEATYRLIRDAIKADDPILDGEYEVKDV